MRPGEHMLDYFGRIKELTQSVLDETTKNSVRVERRVVLAIEKKGLDALIRGLPRDHKTALKFEYYSDFDEILICLLRIYKQIKKEDSKMGISMAKNRVTNIKLINKSINCSYCKCQHCKNFGHLILECRKLKYKIENLNSENLRGEATKDASRSPPPKEHPKSQAQRPGS
ncbi:hypothetical protein M0804_013498 [Polistes exclamans]|nr:hypothetical protein M0804_013498 [Polistes exclamans]